MTNPPSVPSLDVEAQPGPPKLESRVDLHRTAAQPEKEGLAAGSGTPLDVEACVRLLERLAGQAAARAVSDSDYADMHERSHPHIATDHHASAAKYMEEARLLSALASALPGMGKALEHTHDPADDDDSAGEIAIADYDEWREFQAWKAARAAQPEETSADA